MVAVPETYSNCPLANATEGPNAPPGPMIRSELRRYSAPLVQCSPVGLSDKSMAAASIVPPERLIELDPLFQTLIAPSTVSTLLPLTFTMPVPPAPDAEPPTNIA